MQLQEETVKCPKPLLPVCSSVGQMLCRGHKGKCLVCSVNVARCKRSRLRTKIFFFFFFSTLVRRVCLTLMSGGRKAQGEWGYLGWHEQLLTEKQDLFGHHSNTCIAHTGVPQCLQLICAILILMKKRDALPKPGKATDTTQRTPNYSLPLNK